MTDEIDAGERLHCLKVGHVLTDRDIEDIQHVLNEHNQALAEAAEAFHQGERSAIEKIGGKELLGEWDTLYERYIDHLFKRARKYIHEQMAKYGTTH